MGNPKIIRACSACGVEREHYTRHTGRHISPCVECQIAKAKKRQTDIRDDPDKLEYQRVEWARIKKRQRMIYRGDIGTHTSEPDIQPASIPMVDRKRQRRRRREDAKPEDAPPLPVSPSLAKPPSSRRRRRPWPTKPPEAGLEP